MSDFLAIADLCNNALGMVSEIPRDRACGLTMFHHTGVDRWRTIKHKGSAKFLRLLGAGHVV
ncbi:hypothetical protein BL243_25045 [Ralstonia solanacearum]|nr:hypothetical protein BL243_25045 [Ralstonia solanacearum]